MPEQQPQSQSRSPSQSQPREAFQRVVAGRHSVDGAPSAEASSNAEAMQFRAKATVGEELRVSVDRVPGRAVSIGDDPATRDLLGRDAVITSLAAMLKDQKQATPFTIALLGEWGAGKTSVMEMLVARLKTEAPGGFLFARFNAWEYEQTENMAAGFSQEVVRGLTSSMSGLAKIRLQWWLARHKHPTHVVLALFWILAALAGSVLAAGVAVLANDWARGLFGAAAIASFYGAVRTGWSASRDLLQHPSVSELRTYLRLPSYAEHLGLVPILREDIRLLAERCLRSGSTIPTRLVVFVDDLDRCNAESIVQALDSIRLVGNLKNVVVVLALDHRIAFAAVARHYDGLASPARDARCIARDYLGKIVQLPIYLSDPDDNDIQRFVQNKLFANVTAHRNGSEGAAEDRTSTEARGSLGYDLAREMDHHPDEVEHFKVVAIEWNIRNPRTLTRLRNSYRFLKLAAGIAGVFDVLNRELLLEGLFFQEHLFALPDVERKRLEGLMANHHVSAEERLADNAPAALRSMLDRRPQLRQQYQTLMRFVRQVTLPPAEC